MTSANLKRVHNAVRDAIAANPRRDRWYIFDYILPEIQIEGFEALGYGAARIAFGKGNLAYKVNWLHIAGVENDQTSYEARRYAEIEDGVTLPEPFAIPRMRFAEIDGVLHTIAQWIRGESAGDEIWEMTVPEALGYDIHQQQFVVRNGRYYMVDLGL